MGTGVSKKKEPPRKGALKFYPGNVLIFRTLTGQVLPPLRSLTCPENRKIRDGNGCFEKERAPSKGSSEVLSGQRAYLPDPHGPSTSAAEELNLPRESQDP